MRDWSVLIFVFLLAACGTTPPVSVIRTSTGDAPQEEVKGDPIKFKRADQEAFAGGKAGYRVIRVHDDWNLAWPVGKVPDMPASAVDIDSRIQSGSSTTRPSGPSKSVKLRVNARAKLSPSRGIKHSIARAACDWL